ncbi:MurR/RpiR family transcriptional regulator [Culicoidibacter larvae]|uniref:MurR/RpiR family transcriptional regulator n=1 Tax=Culicoidibacter larvae TaxID=2579976 RepID=A0A5R8QEJ5_9FIRM|nr:MurR/RpiR family transcriptional regulator [Culicoidibacter larvae]TLG75396.1 MurR/RpiR family transcriptional regulator [Culicoidibacter larvae]
MTILSSELRERIKLQRENFTQVEQYLAEAIIARPEVLQAQSIDQLAHELNTSKSSISRFARKLGYSGFIELKHTISSSEKHQKNHHNNLIAQYSLLIGDYTKLLNQFIANCNFDDILAIAKLMHTSQRVLIFGLGNSGSVAADFASRLKYSGLAVATISESHGIRIEARHSRPNDLMICFSRSGTSRCIRDALRFGRENGTTTVLITTSNDYTVTTNCDYTIVLPKKEDFIAYKLLSHQIPQLFIADVLYTEMMKLDPKKYQLALEKTSGVLT